MAKDPSRAAVFTGSEYLVAVSTMGMPRLARATDGIGVLGVASYAANEAARAQSGMDPKAARPLGTVVVKTYAAGSIYRETTECYSEVQRSVMARDEDGVFRERLQDEVVVTAVVATRGTGLAKPGTVRPVATDGASGAETAFNVLLLGPEVSPQNVIAEHLGRLSVIVEDGGQVHPLLLDEAVSRRGDLLATVEPLGG